MLQLISSFVGLGFERSYPQNPLPIPPPVSLPEPTSCRPRFTLIKEQETESDLCRYWPEDLTHLGLTAAQRDLVDKHLRDAFRAGSIEFSGKKLTYSNADKSVDIKTELPISIFAGVNKSSYRVLLFPKTVFSAGAERKNKWVYDLTSGEFFIKKRVVGCYEEAIVKCLDNERKARGIESETIWRTVVKEKEQPKRQMIEPIKDGVVSILFGTEPFERFSTKHDLVLDFLKDLDKLHQMTISGTSIRINDFFNRVPTLFSVPEYAAFHYDISIANTLVALQNGKWRGQLSDFGVATANPTAWGGTLGFNSPESIQFYKKQRPFGMDRKSPSEDEKKPIQFNIEYGRKKDLWAMGLVILSILVGRTENLQLHKDNTVRNVTLAPLPCLKACLQPKSWSSWKYEDEGILTLTQETIDQEINQLESEVKAKHKDDVASVGALFKVVRSMIKINPEERKSVQELLREMAC